VKKFQAKNKRREDKKRHIKKQESEDDAFEDADEVLEKEVDGSDYDQEMAEVEAEIDEGQNLDESQF
jgi:hypothetical protein